MGLLFSACLNDSEKKSTIDDSAKDSVNAQIVKSPEGVTLAGDFAPVAVGMKWTYACSSYFGQSRNTPSTSRRTATVYDLEILSLSDSGMTALFHEDVRHAEQSYWQANDSLWYLDTTFERESQVFLEYHAGKVGEWWTPFAPESYQPLDSLTEVVYNGTRRLQWEAPHTDTWATAPDRPTYLSNIGLKSVRIAMGGNGYSSGSECMLVAFSPPQ